MLNPGCSAAELHPSPFYCLFLGGVSLSGWIWPWTWISCLIWQTFGDFKSISWSVFPWFVGKLDEFQMFLSGLSPSCASPVLDLIIFWRLGYSFGFSQALCHLSLLGQSSGAPRTPSCTTTLPQRVIRGSFSTQIHLWRFGENPRTAGPPGQGTFLSHCAARVCEAVSSVWGRVTWAWFHISCLVSPG